MQRTNPNFRREEVSSLELDEFVDELFASLLDTAPIDSDTDKVPNLTEAA